ncbi:MAG: 4Fe-4S cluster-binding domain-containing protein [Lachnospiraceae bacterium]|nr:4Fe-4S cluster-binding domain-containing protein [Lachnospiraceae bacterium]
MQWQNRGHEFDKEAEQIMTAFGNGRKVYVFGAGVLGLDVRQRLELAGCFGGFIDNDEEKQKNGVAGVEVKPFSDYLNLSERGILVIAADFRNVPALRSQVSAAGLESAKDYYVWTDFNRRVYPILLTYYYDKSYVELAQISLTERCTLRCRKCAHACPYTKNSSLDLSLEEAYFSADSFFDKVDIVREFVLIGGEPLLYQELPRVVEYIGERYRHKIFTFSIATNGTVIPSEALLKQCVKYGVVIKISNYSAAVPRLVPVYADLEQTLKRQGVAYEMGGPEMEWFDYGFDYVNKEDASQAEMVRHFDGCKTSCREVRKNKYHYCVMARSVSENMGFDIGNEDYLDLGQLSEAGYKKILLEFNLGYSDKGYLDMCRHCNNAVVAKNRRFPAAEQFE